MHCTHSLTHVLCLPRCLYAVCMHHRITPITRAPPSTLPYVASVRRLMSTWQRLLSLPCQQAVSRPTPTSHVSRLSAGQHPPTPAPGVASVRRLLSTWQRLLSVPCQQANTHLPCQQAVSRPTPTNSCPWCGVGEKVIVYMAATSLRPMSAGQHPPSKSSKSRRSARVPTADWRTATTAACRVQSSTRRCPCVPQQQFLPTAATAQPAAVHLVPKSWLECSQLRPQRAAAAATAIVDGWSAGRQAGTGQRGNTSLWAESVKRVGEWVKEPGACPQQVGCEE
jgi:hypothetical protein